MTIQIAGETKRLGLSLSGGGFRAAGFHLGVFRKLESMELLDKVDVLSCVSGGSIAGAFLALNWGKPDTLDRLEQYLASKSIAVTSFFAGLLDPFETRLEKLADTYDEHLFQGKTLRDLRAGPRVYLNATNLATGRLFAFVAGGGRSEEMGEYRLGYTPAPDFPISRAVAASSAFPPVFPPLRLSPKAYPLAGDSEYITLTDGGVYDNMGVGPLIAKTNDLQFMIVSDGGKPFANSARPTEAAELVLAAGLDIMMEQIRGLQFDRMEYRHKAKSGPKPLWFSIDSTIGEAAKGDAALAAGVSTNLKKLNPSELEVLSRHGGALVQYRIQQYCPELLQA